MNVTKVRYYRIRHDYTIQELADKIGITRQHLNQVELGKEPLSGDIAIKLSHVFDVVVDELFGEKVV